MSSVPSRSTLARMVGVTLDYLQSAPVAVNDTSLNNPLGPVTIVVPAKDIDVDGDLVLSSVDLDPSTPGQQTRLEVAGEGIWIVDRFGAVTFTPLPGWRQDRWRP